LHLISISVNHRFLANLTPNPSPFDGEGLKRAGFLPLSTVWRGGREVEPIRDSLNLILVIEERMYW
jgi:hypothetical protein